MCQGRAAGIAGRPDGHFVRYCRACLVRGLCPPHIRLHKDAIRMVSHMFRQSIFAIAVIGTVSGCTGVVVQDAPAPRGSYYEREFNYATGKGAILTIIAGNPFGGPKEEFDALVRRLMYKQNRELPAEFVASPGDRTRPPYKVVVAFNKEPGISPAEMCANPLAIPTVPEKTQLRIDIAFCHGDTSKSDTSGYASNVSSTADPKFASLIRQATYTMLPEPGATDRDKQSDRAFP